MLVLPSHLSAELQLSYLLRHEQTKADLKQLLSLVNSKNFDVNKTDTEGCTPIFLATWFGQPILVKRLHKMGASITEYNTRFGSTPLMAACMNGRDRVCEYIAPLLTLAQLTGTYRKQLSSLSLCDCDSRLKTDEEELDGSNTDRCPTCACWNGKTPLAMAIYERHDRCAYIVKREIDKRQAKPEPEEVIVPDRPKRKAAAPPPVDDTAELRMELSKALALIASLQAQLAASRHETQLSRDSETDLRRQLKLKTDKLWDADELIRCLERENRALKDRVAQQEAEIAELRKRPTTAAPVDTSGLDARIAVLARDNEALLAENAKLRARVADQDVELERLRKLAAERAARIESLEAEVARLKARIAGQDEQIEQLNKTVGTRDERIKELEDRLSKMNGTEQRILELEREVASLTARCRDQQSQIDNFTGIISSKEDRIRSLESEIERVKAQLNERALQVGKLAIEVQGQQQHIIELEKELARLQELLSNPEPCPKCPLERRRANVFASIIADKHELFDEYKQNTQDKDQRLIDDWHNACDWHKHAHKSKSCFCEHTDGIKPDGSTQIYKCTYCRCFTCNSLQTDEPTNQPSPRSPRRATSPRRASARARTPKRLAESNPATPRFSDAKISYT